MEGLPIINKATTGCDSRTRDRLSQTHEQGQTNRKACNPQRQRKDMITENKNGKVTLDVEGYPRRVRQEENEQHK